MHRQQTIIFTDGSSRGNPGPGGWGAIVKTSTLVQELGGRENSTTNNRMEMKAAIEALTCAVSQKVTGEIIVHTDSSYLINGITKWVHGWQKNNWRTATDEPVVNQDLWKALLDVSSSVETSATITWQYLKGHSGIPGNERCDAIATAMADQDSIDLYKGVPQEYTVDLSITTGRTLGSSSAEKKARAQQKAYSYLSLINGKLEKHHSWAECEARVKGVKGAKFKKSISAEDEKNIIAEWMGK